VVSLGFLEAFLSFRQAQSLGVLCPGGVSSPARSNQYQRDILDGELGSTLEHRFRKNVPFCKVIDCLIAGPVSRIAGYLGYGTEITVDAVKKQDGVSSPPRAL
jgi:hypothetical protein